MNGRKKAEKVNRRKERRRITRNPEEGDGTRKREEYQREKVDGLEAERKNRRKEGRRRPAGRKKPREHRDGGMFFCRRITLAMWSSLKSDSVLHGVLAAFKVEAEKTNVLTRKHSSRLGDGQIDCRVTEGCISRQEPRWERTACKTLADEYKERERRKKEIEMTRKE